MKKSFFLLIALSLTLFFSTCSSGGSKEKTVVFADAGWDSIQIHNAVAGYILEKGFGFTWSQVTGSSAITYEALKSGEIDVYMEVWTDNLAVSSPYPLAVVEDGILRGIVTKASVISTMI